MSFRLALLAAAVVAGSATAALADGVVDFSAYNGMTAPFSAIIPGNTLSFGIIQGAGSTSGSFQVGPSVFQTTSPYTLTDLPDFNTFTGDTLTIAFAAPVDAVRFSYGIEDLLGLSGSDSLTVTDSNNVTLTATPTLVGLFPEGTVSFEDGATFTSLSITNPNGFAIGNVAVPEPATFAVLGLGLAALGLARRRA